jgi:hypothetical protein
MLVRPVFCSIYLSVRRSLDIEIGGRSGIGFEILGVQRAGTGRNLIGGAGMCLAIRKSGNGFTAAEIKTFLFTGVAIRPAAHTVLEIDEIKTFTFEFREFNHGFYQARQLHFGLWLFARVLLYGRQARG